MKKEIPLTIPNKKINPSPQYKNYLPGENIGFKPINQRVTQINSLVVGVIKCKTPAYVLADNVLTVSCETEGASIYYTTDGSMPTVASTMYEEPISIEGDTDFRFVAVKNGMISSDELVVEAASQLSAPVASFDYETGELSIENPNNVGTVYYTTDGSTPTSESTEYTGEITLSEAVTVKAIVIYGDYSSDVITVTFAKANISKKVSKLDFVHNLTSIEYQSSTPNAEFRHTSDGSTPDYSSQDGKTVETTIYGNPVTAKCKVFAEGMIPSDVSAISLGYVKPTAPAISLDNGNVVLSKAGETEPIRNYDIYYTNDGSTPTSESKLYSEPFAAVPGQTIKAIITCYNGQYTSDPSELTIE